MNECQKAPPAKHQVTNPRLLLWVLMIVYVLNFLDRQIVNILAEPISRDLGLSDTQIGLLTGLAFALFYTLLGIPIARYADNSGTNRVGLISISLAVWSAMTALCGLAQNFTQLALARVGVGVGEAAAGPSAYSMISDWFPKARRATAISIYAAGLYLGGGVSLLIGAVVVKGWNTAYPGGGPLGLVGWQAAFMAVGIPGLLLALWVATLIEPIRGRADGLPPPVPMPSGWLPKPMPPRRWRSESLSLLVWVRMTATKPYHGLPRLRKPMAIWNTFATCWVSGTVISVNPPVWSTIKKMVAKPAGSGIIDPSNQQKAKK